MFVFFSRPEEVTQAEDVVQKLGEKHVHKVFHDVVTKPSYVPTLEVLRAVALVYQSQVGSSRCSVPGVESQVSSSRCSMREQETSNRRKSDIFKNKIALAARRSIYLQSVQTLRAAGYPIIYMDEAWFSHPRMSGGRKNKLSLKHNHPANKTLPKVMTIYAGGQSNFVPGTLMVKNLKHCHKSSTRPYGVDKEVFNDYIDQKLLPNIPKNSVIVMDNASFHQRPKISLLHSNTSRDEYQNYHRVKSRNKSLFLPSLEQLQEEAAELCVVLMSHLDHRCVFLRLPPYHTCLNPMELAWGDVRALLRHDMKLQAVRCGEEFEMVVRNNLSLIDEERWRWYMCKVLARERLLLEAETNRLR